ncbi:MAG: CHASE4 domain-containing protein, partial [Devosia sp.]|nr:CHASE4 domain-containing protein [Devosia sp.]
MSNSTTQLEVEFKRRTILPLVGVIFVAFALSMGLLYQVGAGQDERAIEQSTKLLQTEIDGRQATLAKTLKDYSAWGEAYKNLHLNFSLEWAYEQGNAGATLFSGFGFNYVFLVDPNGKTIYSVVDGKLATVQAEGALADGIASLIERARAAGENETVVETGVLRG